jgi:hypothetical protein
MHTHPTYRSTNKNDFHGVAVSASYDVDGNYNDHDDEMTGDDVHTCIMTTILIHESDDDDDDHYYLHNLDTN